MTRIKRHPTTGELMWLVPIIDGSSTSLTHEWQGDRGARLEATQGEIDAAFPREHRRTINTKD